MKELEKTKELINVLLKKDLDSNVGRPITDLEIKNVIIEMESLILDKKMYKISFYIIDIAFFFTVALLLTKL